jgi:hypothetical protein
MTAADVAAVAVEAALFKRNADLAELAADDGRAAHSLGVLPVGLLVSESVCAEARPAPAVVSAARPLAFGELSEWLGDAAASAAPHAIYVNPAGQWPVGQRITVKAEPVVVTFAVSPR